MMLSLMYHMMATVSSIQFAMYFLLLSSSQPTKVIAIGHIKDKHFVPLKSTSKGVIRTIPQTTKGSAQRKRAKATCNQQSPKKSKSSSHEDSPEKRSSANTEQITATPKQSNTLSDEH